MCCSVMHLKCDMVKVRVSILDKVKVMGRNLFRLFVGIRNNYTFVISQVDFEKS